MSEPEFEDIYRQFSVAEEPTPSLLSRRTFLQFIALGLGSAMISTQWGDAAAWGAESASTTDPILVLVQLGGGNDGLNFLPPISAGKYYDSRKSIAIKPPAALVLNADVGLHPSLTFVKAQFDLGRVAAIQGVGYSGPDLSHFASMDTWMTGHEPNSTQRTGWLGRYLDGVSPGPFTAVSMGSLIPLHLVGARTTATALPTSLTSVFGATPGKADDTRLWDSLLSTSAPTGLGDLGDRVARNTTSNASLGSQVRSYYEEALPEGQLSRQMTMAARLLNANLGIRIINTTLGSFDTHQDQTYFQKVLFDELNAALKLLFERLNPAVASRVVVMTFSEFGRRVIENGSYGTDHGTASGMLVLGQPVNGGLKAQYPSLTDVDGNGNLKRSVDFRSVYATILETMFSADSTQVLGSSFERLDLFRSSGTPGVTQPPAVSSPPIIAPTVPSAPPVTKPRGYRMVTAAGLVAAFGEVPKLTNTVGMTNIVDAASTPAGTGFWATASDGSVRGFGDAGHFGSLTGSRLNAPIVGMAGTATGKGYWLLGRDGGIFSFGNASFHGSTGGLKLNQPVVGMAAVPGGGGYWLVAEDGGIFAFGSAKFFGSAGGIRLNKPVVGMAPTSTGNGYWLVSSDGGIFAYGDAQFYGSAGSLRLNQPIVRMALTPNGKGYWLVASDGGVFSYGDAKFEGSLGGSNTGSPIVGFAS